MKKGIIFTFVLIISFVALVIFASQDSINETNLIGCTELNGSGCVCHTTERDTSVVVWVEGPDTLYVGQMGLYKMYLARGPAEAGGYNVAGRFGTMQLVDTFSYQHPLAMNELTQAFSLPFPSPDDTIYWEFGYIASDSSNVDTIYSCGISLVWDTIPDAKDRWNFGPKFPLTIIDEPVSVENEDIVPNQFKLYQNYPNPFNPSTKIKFSIAQDDNPGKGQNLVRTTLKIYDILGNEIAILINNQLSGGEYEVEFEGNGLPSGIYLYSLNVNGYRIVKKMALLR